MNNFNIQQIKGVIPALLTCFDENEQFDIGRTQGMVDYLLTKKIGGLYITGSSGEGFLMTNEERMSAVETIVAQVDGKIPVIAHIGDIGTKKSVELAKHAWQAGASAISSVPPFYWKFSENDVYSYYEELAKATPLPMILYNIPLAGAMSLSLIERLAELPNVQGLKFTGKEHDQMAYIIERCGHKLQVYSGSDEIAFSGLSFGAAGLIGTFYNIMPELYIAMESCVKNSDIKAAIRLQKIAIEIIFTCLPYDFISLLHSMMKWVGVDAGCSRKPFTRYTQDDLDPLIKTFLQIREKYNVTEVDFINYLAEHK